MLLNILVGFALATSAIAAPFTESSLNSTMWTPDYILQQDEVILYGDGRRRYYVKTKLHRGSSLTLFTFYSGSCP